MHAALGTAGGNSLPTYKPMEPRIILLWTCAKRQLREHSAVVGIPA